MHHLTTFEIAAACVIFFLAMCFIVILIGAGFKFVADERIKEAEQTLERKAERLARQMVKDRLEGVQIQVTQRISVIEEDFGR